MPPFTKNIHPLFIIVFIIVVFLSACQNNQDKGEALARRHCSACHAFVEPSMLDKKTWERHTLPEMAFRMGLDVKRLSSIPENDMLAVLTALPLKPLVSETEWKLLVDYFLENAPDTLPNSEPGTYSLVQQFSVSSLRLPVKNNTQLTVITYDALNKNFFLGTRQGILYKTTPTFMLLDSFQLRSPPSDILFKEEDSPLILCMGNMDPNDQPSGSVNVLAGQGKESLVVIDSLKRPVDLQYADFNNDGQQDLIVSAFGHFTGGLFAYENKQGHYIKHVVHSFPGTRKTIVRDFTDDGLPDILSLIAQGDEHIALFSNRGKFKFSYQVLMKFPPVYGSSYFELVDFNSDGHSDILYTNGDNADYSPVLKPYHGVRIFINDGHNQFSELLFHPMHGASMAKGADFDQDGDIDIAVISFFPDFRNHPEHSFIYFENENGTLVPQITKLAASSRWLTMEVGDFDDDRDLDIVLTAMTFPNAVPDSLYQAWKDDRQSLLRFENNLRSAN